MKFLSTKLAFILALTMFIQTTLPQNVQAYTLEDYSMEIESKDGKIAEVFNKYRYSMTVEWDQEDPYFKEQAERELEENLIDLQKKA